MREVRRASFASQVAQPGVQRVKAIIPGGPAADVAVDVAVLDTGIGPSAEDKYGDWTGEPVPMIEQEPQGKPELNIRGGVNCWDDPSTTAINEAWEGPYDDPGEAEVEACRDLFSDSGADTIGATLIDDLLVVRYLGGSTELARRQFSTLWQTLRPRAFGRPASTPRIWAT